MNNTLQKKSSRFIERINQLTVRDTSYPREFISVCTWISGMNYPGKVLSTLYGRIQFSQINPSLLRCWVYVNVVRKSCSFWLVILLPRLPEHTPDEGSSTTWKGLSTPSSLCVTTCFRTVWCSFQITKNLYDKAFQRIIDLCFFSRSLKCSFVSWNPQVQIVHTNTH